METASFTYLDLCAPLLYTKAEKLPFEIHESEEFLLFYELDRTQCLSIEPERASLAGKLTFIGRKTTDSPDSLPEAGKDSAILPAGKYIFTQYRGNSALLKQEEWLDMAIEQQKDALWERYKIKNRLYIRYLYEDNAFVTQLFRGL